MTIRTVALFAVVAMLTVHGIGRGATLVRQGQAAAVIALPADANANEKLAAKELIENIEKISGAKLESQGIAAGAVDAFVTKAKADHKAAILLGRLALPKVEQAMGEKAKVRGAFALQVTGDLVLAGGPEEGTYYAVMELLEQLGVRWFMPGDLGTVIPEMKTVELADQTTVQAPSFVSRHFQMGNPDWQKRVRCGGETFLGGHGIHAPAYAKDPKTGEYGPKENAEYYSLVDGQRVPRQHCVSNPKLIAYVVQEVKAARKAGRGPVIGMGPNDGAGFCQCENCRKLDSGDFDPFSNEPSVTDRYVWFFNQVLKGVEDEYPDTKLAFYIYHSYMRPPKREKLDPRIIGALAPIALDRVHGFSNPIAPEKSYAKWLYQEWGKIMPELYDRGYWSNLACPGFTFIIVNRLRDEIPACYDLGVKGWRVETFGNYGPQFPSMYIAAKLMWNHKADVDALMKDCYERFFGPAAGPMGQYITMMDAALRDGDYCTGGSWDMPHFYPPELRGKARAMLNEGQKLAAGKGAYEDRVRMITETFDLTEAFCKMMEARVQVDFPTAKAELEKADAVANKLMEMKPVPMLVPGRFSMYLSYMNRFYRPCTEEGYARVTGGNKLVAAAKDEWDFQIDPMKIGEEIGLYRENLTGGNWQKIKTTSFTWSDQGLRYYKGLAWYRQVVEVPKEFVGQRVFFWCGGVDEAARVWINGKPIGNSHRSTFRPFELDATDALKPGKNVITVCVANLVVNDVGTGGIMNPVMLYAPAEGKDAKLKNVSDLKPTFP